VAFVVNDRVQENTNSIGTGTIDLDGAVPGFESFISAIGNGNDTYYTIAFPDQSEFEVGVGTVTSGSPNTLSRDSIISSSNGDALVNFSAGVKTVICTLPASKAILINTSNIVQIPTNTILDLAAGTTTTAPLEFTSGSFLTSSTAGAVEYDGQIFTSSPVALKRGLSPSTMLRYNTGTTSIANTSTNAQAWLGAANITVAGSTAYSFRGWFRLFRAAGGTSRILRTEFGGTATLTAINYRVTATNTAAQVVAALSEAYVQSAAAFSITAASTSTTLNNFVNMEGVAQINAAGTFIPQLSFSATPGGTATIAEGAYFEMTPIGVNNATINIGHWA
jgi:hypothetical protein